MRGRVSDRRIDDEFLELVCSDEDLLAAEFEAIIAANWPGPPSAPVRGAPFAPDHRARRRQPTRGRTTPVPDPVGGVVPERSRERSPPGARGS